MQQNPGGGWLDRVFTDGGSLDRDVFMTGFCDSVRVMLNCVLSPFTALSVLYKVFFFNHTWILDLNSSDRVMGVLKKNSFQFYC